MKTSRLRYKKQRMPAWPPTNEYDAQGGGLAKVRNVSRCENGI
jgi:hypothetical protein